MGNGGGSPFNLRIELHQFEYFFVNGRRKSVPRNPLAMWNLYEHGDNLGASSVAAVGH